MNNYYVYVYIDPRNFEEFYFGKGKGSRKEAHLFENNESTKVKRIKDIQQADLEPIIRVIARNLSESEALLVEKTLLWKLGKLTTNISSGHYSDNFRPHDSMHVELSGFDYQSGIYYYNVGEGEHRNWGDFIKHNFISAGQGIRWKDSIKGFQVGDIFAAYLKNHGFVGIGKIKTIARPIREIQIDGIPLLQKPLISKQMSDNLESDDLCEYVCLVDWLEFTDRSKAKWKPKSGLYTTTHVRASLDAQPITISYLEQEFNINIRELLK